MTERLRTQLLPSLLALLGAFLVGTAIVALSGHSPGLAWAALFEGAFGSLDGLSEVGVKTCPLLLAGLGVALAFRTGVWNIGVEGQLLMGALAMAALGTRSGVFPAALQLATNLASAAAAGAAWAGLAARLKLRRNVNEVIGTIMLNFVALGFVGYLVQGPLMESGGHYPQSDAILPMLRLPRLFPPHRLHLGLPLALAAAVAVHVLLFRTVAGYEMRAAGANPRAARLAGIDVDRRLMWAMMLGGALAGLAGGVEVCAVTHRLYERFSPGWGFTAIAVGLLGRLSPLGVVVAAVFFGALDAGSSAMQRVAGVSSVLVSIIQGTVILFLVALEKAPWQPRSLPGDDPPAPSSALTGV